MLVMGFQKKFGCEVDGWGELYPILFFIFWKLAAITSKMHRSHHNHEESPRFSPPIGWC